MDKMFCSSRDVSGIPDPLYTGGERLKVLMLLKWSDHGLVLSLQHCSILTPHLSDAQVIPEPGPNLLGVDGALFGPSTLPPTISGQRPPGIA